MKVSIDFEERELQEPIQAHLDGGPSVQRHIKAAIRFFNDARRREKEGSAVGYGSADRMKAYNHVMVTDDYFGAE